MTATATPLDWPQIRIALAELADYVPEDMADLPIGSPVLTMCLCPFGQTQVIVVLTNYTRWRCAKISVYEKEEQYPSAFWMYTKEVATPKEALEMCRQQDIPQ